MNPNAQVKVHRFKDNPYRRLSKPDLLLTSDTVRAYSLKDKRWLHVFISQICPIVFSTTAFDSLVLPPASKDLIHAFATSSTTSTAPNLTTSSDLIKDKGLGTVLLLSGPPGVGKTLTAESVAEAMRVPLYTLSAGDLGTNPKDVERVLTSTLQLASKWKAMILLDEADVFLRSRSSEKMDLERNKLVSIFLRVLEYHSGFLFLTTNRIEDVDAAFESRIHLSLQYRDLGFDARKTVWMGFLGRSVEGTDGRSGVRGFREGEVEELARQDMNGRQIKNAVRSARMLGESRGEELGMGHLRVVLKVREENRSAFDKIEEVGH